MSGQAGDSTEFEGRIGDSTLIALYRYWDERRGTRFAPARRDIDPADIPKLLPHLLLVEILDGRYRYRVCGTEVERHFGCSMGGKCVDELMRGEYLAYINSLYERLIATCAPVYSESAYANAETGRAGGHSVFRTKRLMLPLSSDGDAVDMALVGQVFFSNRGAGEQTVLVTQDRFDDLLPPGAAADRA
jgi:hypothetical protein